MDVIGPHASRVLEEEVGGDIVLYDPEEKKFFELNATASDVWRLANGEYSLDEIVERLVSAYGAEEAVVRRDVTAVLAMMREAGLFEEASVSGNE